MGVEVTALQAEYHEAEVESELSEKELANTTSLLEIADDVKRPLEEARLELSKAIAERDASAARLKSEVLKNDRLDPLRAGDRRCVTQLSVKPRECSRVCVTFIAESRS